MADDKKVKKTKKKKEEGGEAAPAAEAAPAPAEAAPAAPAPAPAKKASTRESKKAKRTGSVGSMFSQNQVAEYKEAFSFMDADKDGVIGKGDLRATFDALGRMVSDKEMDELLGECVGTLNFNGLLTLFANRMSGSADDDDVVVAAFKSFDEGGKIDSEKLRHALMTWGEKFSSDEWDDATESMTVDGAGKIDTSKLIQMLTAAGDEEEAEE